MRSSSIRLAVRTWSTASPRSPTEGRSSASGSRPRRLQRSTRRALWEKNNALRGVFLGGALLSEYSRVHAMIADLIERVGAAEIRVVIDRTFPLAEAAAAHAYIESRQAFGRVVMTP